MSIIYKEFFDNIVIAEKEPLDNCTVVIHIIWGRSFLMHRKAPCTATVFEARPRELGISESTERAVNTIALNSPLVFSCIRN